MKIVRPIQRQSDLVDGKSDKYLFWHLVTTLQYSIRSMCESVWRLESDAACGPGTSSSTSSSPRPIVPVLRQLGGGGDNTRWRHRAHAAICPCICHIVTRQQLPANLQSLKHNKDHRHPPAATLLSAMCSVLNCGWRGGPATVRIMHISDLDFWFNSTLFWCKNHFCSLKLKELQIFVC